MGGVIRASSQKGLFSSASLFLCLSVASDNLFQIITTLSSPECSLVKGFPGRRVFLPLHVVYFHALSIIPQASKQPSSQRKFFSLVGHGRLWAWTSQT